MLSENVPVKTPRGCGWQCFAAWLQNPRLAWVLSRLFFILASKYSRYAWVLSRHPGGADFFASSLQNLCYAWVSSRHPGGADCFAAWLQNFRFSLRLFCIVASIQYYCTLCLSIYPSDVVCRKIHSQLKRCRNPCMDTCHNSMVSLKEQCFVA